jgi:hypothetical protein
MGEGRSEGLGGCFTRLFVDRTAPDPPNPLKKGESELFIKIKKMNPKFSSKSPFLRGI